MLFLDHQNAREYSVAEWQSGYAAACKAVYLGSIPGSASIPFVSSLAVPTVRQPAGLAVDKERTSH